MDPLLTEGEIHMLDVNLTEGEIHTLDVNLTLLLSRRRKQINSKVVLYTAAFAVFMGVLITNMCGSQALYGRPQKKPPPSLQLPLTYRN